MEKKGFLLIELFIAITILLILLNGSLSLAFPAIRSVEIGRQRLQAGLVLWEEEEAIRQIRNESWTNLVPAAGTYFPQYNSTSNPPTTYQGWQLVSGVGSKTISGTQFLETVTITLPLRVDSNTLSDSSGTADTGMRKLVYKVTWLSFGKQYSLSITNYVSDWQPF